MEEDIAGQMSTQELNIVEDDNSLRKGRCGVQILTPETFHINITVQ